MSSQASLSIGGMTCGNCSSAIERLLTSLKGVHHVSVSLLLNSSIIKFDENTISTDLIMEEIEDIGFDVSLVSIRKLASLQSSSSPSSSSYIENITKKNKYYITSNQINKEHIIIWSAHIDIHNNDNNSINEPYFYDMMSDIMGIIEISYQQNTSQLTVTFNRNAILPMTITHLFQHNSDDITPCDIRLSPKYKGYKPKDDISSEIKTISFFTQSLIKSFTTMKQRRLKQKFNKNITNIELDMNSNNLHIKYINSTDSPHTARDIYKYLKHQMNFHDVICVDTMRNESEIYHKQQEREVGKLKKSFLLACSFGIPCLIIAMILPLVTVIHDNILMFPIIPGNNSVTLLGVVLCILSTPVQFYVGKQFYISAWNAAKHKTSNMSTLIALGTTMAWVYSFVVLLIALVTPRGNSVELHEGAHFFSTSATVITIVLLGKWLQAKATYKTCDAISMLIDIQSSTANLIQLNEYGEIVIDPSSDNTDISTELIVVGDVIKVYVGGRLPLDGSIVYGSSTIDESMVTGEHVPRDVTIGDTVISSSINCGDSMILVRVDRNKADSVISKVIELMKTSQMTKPKQQEFADTVSSYFVPLVVMISLTTFVCWYAFCIMGYVPEEWWEPERNCVLFAIMFAMAVMVIACPCALGLATPTAVMVGMGVASKYGCLIKGGNVLELAYNLDILVFDKTGTLTHGKPKVIDFENLSPKTEILKERLLFYLGSAELNSQHPLAKAIVSFAQKELRNISSSLHLQTPTFCRAIPGKGMKTVVDGHTVNIGNYDWFFNSSMVNTLRLPDDVIRDDIESMLFKRNDEGHITLLMSIDNELVSYLCLFDSPRDESKMLVQELQNKYKMKCVMLTGDNHHTAIAIAKQIGIHENNVISQVLPQEKHQVIKDLQTGKIDTITYDIGCDGRRNYVSLSTIETGDDHDNDDNEELLNSNINVKRNDSEYIYKVGMVGDGINDAAALAQANFGIAIGDGTDIAIEAADMILMNDNLWNIATLLDLSKTIIHRIYLNFVFSFGFNVLGIPIAAGILYPSLRLRLPPEIASIAMACSSLCVLTSSIALKWYKSPYISAK